MPDDVDALGVTIGNNRDARVLLDARRKIDEPIIDFPSQCGFREPWPDRACDFAQRDGAWK